MEAHDTLGRILSEADADEGMRHLEIVFAAEPDHQFCRVSLARHYFLRGERARGLAFIEDAAGRPIVPMASARFAIWARDRERAAKILELLTDPTPQAEVGRQLLRSFLHDEPAGFGELRGDAGLQRHPLVAFLAQVQAEEAVLRGDNERLFDALARADHADFIDAAWLRACPLFDDVRDEPRFVAIRKSVNERAARIHAAYVAPDSV
jgi:serine/threonine-protein kinase